MEHENIILYGILIIVAIALIFSLYSFYNSRYGANYHKALASQNPNDICATPPGYTDEQWREHMSHHPDIYKQCLTNT